MFLNRANGLNHIGISISEDSNRTKPKLSDLGYRSEFLGLNISIDLGERTIVLPIECQLQAIEQYENSKTGFAAHSKMNNKGVKLRKPPLKRPTPNGDPKHYTSNDERLKSLRENLTYLMYNAPTYSITTTTKTDFVSDRTITTTYDLYESFRLITNVQKGEVMSQKLEEYLGDLYERREELIPTDELPEYNKASEIPNMGKDFKGFQQFFSKLRESVNMTFQRAYQQNPKLIDADEAHGEH